MQELSGKEHQVARAIVYNMKLLKNKSISEESRLKARASFDALIAHAYRGEKAPFIDAIVGYVPKSKKFLSGVK